jgi:putative phosphoesterase
LRVGVLSDTHGLLRPEARQFLVGCDYIVHGGDIGHPDILEILAGLAPLTVVRGNNDTQEWARRIPASDLIRIGGVNLYVIHDLADLGIEPAGADVRVVVCGHSHQPRVAERDGVLYVNPGSCGPRRFNLPISVAELIVNGDAVSARIIEFSSPSGRREKVSQ